MTSPNLDPHDRHDRQLISAAVAGDVDGTDRGRADALIHRCSDCATLAADLRAIADATRVLPARVRPLTADFRLTADAARRLERGGLWRQLLRPFAASRSTAPRIAAALTTLGVVGLLLAVVPFAPLGGPASQAGGVSSQDESRSLDAVGKPEAQPPSVQLDLGATGYGADGTIGAAGAQNAPEVGPATPEAKAVGEAVRDDGPTRGPLPLAVLSIGFLAAGLGLFALRRLARRLG